MIVALRSKALSEGRSTRSRGVRYRRDGHIRQTLKGVKVERGVPVAYFQKNDFQTFIPYKQVCLTNLPVPSGLRVRYKNNSARATIARLHNRLARADYERKSVSFSCRAVRDS